MPDEPEKTNTPVESSNVAVDTSDIDEIGPTNFADEATDADGGEPSVTAEDRIVDDVLIQQGPFSRYKSHEAEMGDISVSYDRMKARQSPAPKPTEQVTDKDPNKEVPAEEVPSTQVPTQQQQTVTRSDGRVIPARDYSGIPEEHVPLFQKMGNAAFAYFKPLYHEHQKAKERETQLQTKLEEVTRTGVPSSYYQHPQAYALSPKYATLQQRTQLANAVLQHWTEQAIKIRRAEPFRDLIPDKDGNITMAEPKDATAEDEIKVQQYLQYAQHQHMTAQNAQQQFESTWKSSFDKDVATIKQFEEQYFPGYDDEKHPTKPVQKNIIERLPESQRDNVLAPLIAKIGASNVTIVNQFKALKAENDKLRAKLGLKAKQQPASVISAGGRGNGSAISFQRMRNRHNSDD